MIKPKNNILLTFNYVGIAKTGQKMRGEIEAKNLVFAKVRLREQGITIHKITQKRIRLCNRKNKKIAPSDVALFSRQLATIIESGIPLIQALDIIAKGQSNRSFTELIDLLKQDIKVGLTLSEAFKKHPVYFNKLFCNLIEAGEKSGSLETMLNNIATYKEKIEVLKKKIISVLSYPIALVTVTFIVTCGLLLFVVPQFESLFKGFGAELPAITNAVVHMSKLLQSYWYLIISLFAIIIYAFLYMQKHSMSFTENIDSILLKIPIIGTIIQKASIARFSRTLAITFAAGLPLVQALQSVAGATGNSTFSLATEQIKKDITTGQQMHKAMEHSNLFPNMVIQMVMVGEESGSLEQMLNKIADFYEEEVDNAMKNMSNLLEPIIMTVLGLLVGILVIAMYLPIFKLGSVI